MQRPARACSEERAARLFFHSRPIKFLIYGVVVAVPVVDAKRAFTRQSKNGTDPTKTGPGTVPTVFAKKQ